MDQAVNLLLQSIGGILVLDFLIAVGETFAALMSFIVNIVSGLLYMIGMIPKAFAVISMSFGYMPAVLVTFAAAGIAISIVYLIIGR